MVKIEKSTWKGLALCALAGVPMYPAAIVCLENAGMGLGAASIFLSAGGIILALEGASHIAEGRGILNLNKWKQKPSPLANFAPKNSVEEEVAEEIVAEALAAEAMADEELTPEEKEEIVENEDLSPDFVENPQQTPIKTSEGDFSADKEAVERIEERQAQVGGL